jgi:hypothetical protein
MSEAYKRIYVLQSIHCISCICDTFLYAYTQVYRMVKVRAMERNAKCDKCRRSVLKGELMVGWPAKFGPVKLCRSCGAKHLASVLVELASHQEPIIRSTGQATLVKTEKCNGAICSRKSKKK